MNLSTALAVFSALEAHRYEDGDVVPDEPLFNVRLDAGTDRPTGAREYRVRVTLGGLITEVTHETWQMVLDVAREHDLTVDLQNAGVELRS